MLQMMYMQTPRPNHARAPSFESFAQSGVASAATGQ
jgi:hypothetical protein